MTPTNTCLIVRERVNRELKAMEAIGMFVPPRAYQLADRLFTADYVGMSVNEIADTMVDIAYIESRATKPVNPQGETA